VSAAENKKIVEEMWATLYQKNWDALSNFFAPESHYEDVPAPDPGADGPENIIKRLRIGLEPIVRFEHEIHRVVAENENVVVEHTETWHFETGEKLVNHFTTIHVVEDGKIMLWRDYWDLNTMMAQAPQWWLERIAKFSDSDFA
jgi:limonene-1,2-epoxide hydrolase